MFVYRNKNTGDVVRYEYRSARLDMLPNWELLEEPQPEEPPGGDDGDGPGASKPPARSASKADWQAYARPRAQDSDEAAAIEKLTRDELVALYGGDS